MPVVVENLAYQKTVTSAWVDPDETTDAVKTTTVKTGDAANVIPFFGMTLLAAGAVIVIAFKKNAELKKRRQAENELKRRKLC